MWDGRDRYNSSCVAPVVSKEPLLDTFCTPRLRRCVFAVFKCCVASELPGSSIVRFPSKYGASMIPVLPTWRRAVIAKGHQQGLTLPRRVRASNASSGTAPQQQ